MSDWELSLTRCGLVLVVLVCTWASAVQVQVAFASAAAVAIFRFVIMLYCAGGGLCTGTLRSLQQDNFTGRGSSGTNFKAGKRLLRGGGSESDRALEGTGADVDSDWD